MNSWDLIPRAASSVSSSRCSSSSIAAQCSCSSHSCLGPHAPVFKRSYDVTKGTDPSPTHPPGCLLRPLKARTARVLSALSSRQEDKQFVSKTNMFEEDLPAGRENRKRSGRTADTWKWCRHSRTPTTGNRRRLLPRLATSEDQPQVLDSSLRQEANRWTDQGLCAK